MALGGGIFTAQNKILPGYYVNFSSASRAASALSERGTVAIPLALKWGPTDTVLTVTNADYQKNCQKIFGYAPDAAEMLPIRELFKNASKLLVYRLVNGGVKAANTFATAKYVGTRGNDLKTVIAKNADDNTLFDVSTYLNTTLIDLQTVSAASGLVSNDYCDFKSNATLAVTAGTAFTGGTDGSALTGTQYSDFLDKIEPYSFHALGCPTAEASVIALFVSFTKRMRDEVGAKFKTVVYKTAGDYEGIINVENTCTGTGEPAYGLVYWVAGAEAGCAVNKSNTNKAYDGELTVDVDYTQLELEAALKAGKFIFHNVNGTIRVLEDINSLVTLTDDKGADFQSNQTVRVCDQIANDIAVMFATRYLGTVPNDAAGRVSLWNDICKLHQELETIRAIEDFDTDSVSVERGDSKKAVVCNIAGLNVINAMSQLYMTVVVA